MARNRLNRLFLPVFSLKPPVLRQLRNLLQTRKSGQNSGNETKKIRRRNDRPKIRAAEKEG